MENGPDRKWTRWEIEAVGSACGDSAQAVKWTRYGGQVFTILKPAGN